MGSSARMGAERAVAGSVADADAQGRSVPLLDLAAIASPRSW